MHYTATNCQDYPTDTISRVEYVLDECEDLLSDQEERWVYDFLQFLNDPDATKPSPPTVVIDRAMEIVERLGENYDNEMG